jgi:Uri superfamily endonuclease
MKWSIIGTYVLALRLDAPCSIAIGRLGEFEFPAGWYLYVGSARGPGGLHARLARHKRRLGADKQAHWHVDYVREQAAWCGAWGRASDQPLECTWASVLRHLPGARVVARGFGASDCSCPAHLLHMASLPDDEWFMAALKAEPILMASEELEGLLRMLTSGDDESREAGALALGRFGAAAIGPLATMLAGGDADARWWAARALAEVGGEGTVPHLIRALTDPEPDVRACAALALGRIGEASVSLAARLSDESAFVAAIAADALSMIGQPAADVLIEMLADRSPHARLLAVRTLGRIKAQSSIGPLFGMLEDPSYLVRYYAQEALEALGVGMVFLAS